MSEHQALEINPTEAFGHLRAAPIVEAVIQWTARATKPLEREELQRHLVERLPDYPERQPQHRMLFESQLAADGSSTEIRQAGWHGFRLTSTDKLHIIQISRDGVAFSRLTPYQRWDEFAAAAQRVWRIFVELAQPSEVERLGARFINRVLPVKLGDVGQYLTSPPNGLKRLGLSLSSFLHQSTYHVPVEPFCINVIETIQPPAPPDAEGFGLIVDIDVFTTKPLEATDDAMRAYFPKMRWLKNKVFFSLMSETAIRSFR